MFLYGNLFTGTMPLEFNNLNLERIQLQNNLLSGTLPDGLYSNNNLRELRLDNNTFEGTLSSLIENLVQLRDFRLSSNDFSGSLPNEFAALTNLGTFIFQKEITPQKFEAHSLGGLFRNLGVAIQ